MSYKFLIQYVHDSSIAKRKHKGKLFYFTLSQNFCSWLEFIKAAFAPQIFATSSFSVRGCI